MTIAEVLTWDVKQENKQKKLFFSLLEESDMTEILLTGTLSLNSIKKGNHFAMFHIFLSIISRKASQWKSISFWLKNEMS